MQSRVPLGPGKFHVVVLVLLVSSTGRFPIYFFGAVFIAWQWKLLKPGRAFPALSPVFENFCRFLRPDRPLLGLRGWPMGVSCCCGKFCWWLCLVPRLSQQKWYLPQCNCSNLHNMQDDRWQNKKVNSRFHAVIHVQSVIRYSYARHTVPCCASKK